MTRLSTKAAHVVGMTTFEEMQQQDARDAYERLESLLDTLPLVGVDSNIVGYTYRAENHRPAALVEILITEGRLSPGARGMDADEALDQLAAIEGVDREDEYSFDSDEFPKVVYVGNVSEYDEEWLARS